MSDRGFICSRRAAAAAMRYMHAHNVALAFDNSSGDFMMLVRCNYDMDSVEECEFEVGVCVQDGQTTLARALKYEVEGDFDDDAEDLFVVGSCEVDDIAKLEPDDAAVGALVRLVNEVHNWRICNCAKGFAKWGDPECLLCMFTASDAELDAMETSDPCLVCREACGSRWVKVMDCCKCKLHERCFARWAEQNAKCPHCRAEIPDAAVDAVVTVIVGD